MARPRGRLQLLSSVEVLNEAEFIEHVNGGSQVQRLDYGDSMVREGTLHAFRAHDTSWDELDYVKKALEPQNVSYTCNDDDEKEKAAHVVQTLKDTERDQKTVLNLARRILESEKDHDRPPKVMMHFNYFYFTAQWDSTSRHVRTTDHAKHYVPRHNSTLVLTLCNVPFNTLYAGIPDGRVDDVAAAYFGLEPPFEEFGSRMAELAGVKPPRNDGNTKLLDLVLTKSPVDRDAVARFLKLDADDEKFAEQLLDAKNCGNAVRMAEIMGVNSEHVTGEVKVLALLNASEILNKDAAAKVLGGETFVVQGKVDRFHAALKKWKMLDVAKTLDVEQWFKKRKALLNVIYSKDRVSFEAMEEVFRMEPRPIKDDDLVEMEQLAAMKDRMIFSTSMIKNQRACAASFVMANTRRNMEIVEGMKGTNFTSAGEVATARKSFPEPDNILRKAADTPQLLLDFKKLRHMAEEIANRDKKKAAKAQEKLARAKAKAEAEAEAKTTEAEAEAKTTEAEAGAEVKEVKGAGVLAIGSMASDAAAAAGTGAMTMAPATATNAAAADLVACEPEAQAAVPVKDLAAVKVIKDKVTKSYIKESGMKDIVGEKPFNKVFKSKHDGDAMIVALQELVNEWRTPWANATEKKLETLIEDEFGPRPQGAVPVEPAAGAPPGATSIGTRQLRRALFDEAFGPEGQLVVPASVGAGVQPGPNDLHEPVWILQKPGVPAPLDLLQRGSALFVELQRRLHNAKKHASVHNSGHFQLSATTDDFLQLLVAHGLHNGEFGPGKYDGLKPDDMDRPDENALDMARRYLFPVPEHLLGLTSGGQPKLNRPLVILAGHLTDKKVTGHRDRIMTSKWRFLVTTEKPSKAYVALVCQFVRSRVYDLAKHGVFGLRPLT